ncbi:MAG TPA: hypothetical protein VGP72_12360 [Planctomycetota bacterium]|jgi:hypothetical protein
MATKTELWGDCHNHSTFSDGMMTVAEMARYYEAFGNDFRLQTDHLAVGLPDGKPSRKWLHAADWPEYCAACRQVSTDKHLCIPGVEVIWDIPGPVAKEWSHLKLHPGPGQGFPDESFFSAMTFPKMLHASKLVGLRPIIAHADQKAPLETLSGEEICGLELRADIEETRPLLGRESLKHWDRMLTAGHRISLSSGSDAHQPDLWAGSGMRTVLVDTPREPEAIVQAIVAGRSYLSATWHPDCYAAAGWPEHDNPVAGGKTHMTPWWDFKIHPELRDKPPRELIEDIFQRALKDGRCRREDFPALTTFAINDVSAGGEVRAGKCEVKIEWRTHRPVRTLRLISAGAALKEFAPAGQSASASLDLTPGTYVRLELEAFDPVKPDERETILSNPIYAI